jgi:hypothetical protein
MIGQRARCSLFRRLLVPALIALLAPIAVFSGPAMGQRVPDAPGRMRGQVPATSSNGSVTAVVRFPTRNVIAGSTVVATVVVKNHSGVPLRVDGCGAPFALAFENKAAPATVAWPACARPMTIPIGTSEYRVTAVARSSSCGDDGPDRCIDQRPPPLPVGRYTATLYQNPEILTKPARSIKVRVIH